MRLKNTITLTLILIFQMTYIHASESISIGYSAKYKDFEHFAETMMTLMGRGPELVEKWAGITNPEVVFIQEWEEGDVMIWDNRNTVHTFHGGWRLGERVFRKLELGCEPGKAAL